MSMRVVQVSRPGGPLEVVERPIPEPGHGEVLIKVEACGVCHSDSIIVGGYMPNLTYPRVPGHEVVGRIHKVGEGVPTQFKPQTRVGLGWVGSFCHTCNNCRRGRFISCEVGTISGITRDGGYAEYMIAREEALALVPEDLDAGEAAPLFCAGVTVFNSMRNVEKVLPGDLCVVLGIGGLGHLAIQFANRMGLNVVAVSSSASKRDLALQLGAHKYIDASATDPIQEIKKMGGAKLIVVTAPGAEEASKYVNALGWEGTLLILAALNAPLQVDSNYLLANRGSVKSWPSGNPSDSQDTIQFAAASGCKSMIQTYKLENAQQAYDDALSNKCRFRAVLIP